jgi:hypothetical protein
MCPMKPLGEPEAVTLSFQFDVSDDWIEEQLIETGVKMPDEWETEFRLPDLEPEARAAMIRAHRLYLQVEGYPQLHAPVDDPRQFLMAIADWLVVAARRQSEEESLSASLSAEESAQARDFEEDRDRWIGEAGSNRLRTASSRNYKINRSYAIERAEAEFPRFWVVVGDDVEVRERTDPSEEALGLEDSVKAWMSRDPDRPPLEPRIVWMVEAPRELEEFAEENNWMIEQQEVIVIPSFLGRYSLILPVDQDLARPVGEDDVE